MNHIVWIIRICCIAAALSGCAATLPVQQVRQASAAYDAAAAAGAPLLDELAIAERRASMRTASSTTRTLKDGDLTVLLTFDVKRASSFASIGEPESTAAQRRGVRIVGAYFDVLEALAEGRNIEEAKARIQTLAANVAGLAALATGGAAVVVAPLVEALGPLIEAAARAENAEELRRLVLDGAKPVDDLIGRLIDSAPGIYAVLIAEPESAAEGPLFDNRQARRAELVKIAGYHVTVANYVVLLEHLRTTFGALVAAVRAPTPVTLSSLVATSNELLIQAESVRRAYALLRRP
jgi:hypothetical protein